MTRFHVHVGVADLDQSIRFYSALFNAEPSVVRQDYAKWMIDDPRINFAISKRGHVGVNHLGIQADNAEDLPAIRERFAAADVASLHDEPGSNCCYARSDKHWVADPQGVVWEGYHTMAQMRYFDRDEGEAKPASACCGEESERQSVATGCCAPAATAGAQTAATRCCA